MPIIIWGSRGLNSTVESGTFHCPACERQREYDLKESRRWFTLYFIPIFPISGTQRYVECQRCGQAFKESVLDYEAPSKTDRILTQVYDDLTDGASLDSLKRKLVQQGMADDEAEDLLVKMCDGQPKQCVCGQRLHPDVAECSYCGARL
jgi:zinc-ribbon family